MEKLSRSRVEEMLDYATDYGTFTIDTPDGTPSQHGGTPMNDLRRDSIRAFTELLEHK